MVVGYLLVIQRLNVTIQVERIIVLERTIGVSLKSYYKVITL